MGRSDDTSCTCHRSHLLGLFPHSCYKLRAKSVLIVLVSLESLIRRISRLKLLTSRGDEPTPTSSLKVAPSSTIPRGPLVEVFYNLALVHQCGGPYLKRSNHPHSL
ncbi:hypothetical protein PIB30_089774 [Stylosanthes scabra]|uniref:Uncharacterized protein n=1 Tax=Stylosanthes scabra TaxID=79078 RepID=A0ABU6RUL3_9FABA|nr:hypothetical protein [Stylosanthes scabra]